MSGSCLVCVPLASGMSGASARTRHTRRTTRKFPFYSCSCCTTTSLLKKVLVVVIPKPGKPAYSNQGLQDNPPFPNTRQDLKTRSLGSINSVCITMPPPLHFSSQKVPSQLAVVYLLLKKVTQAAYKGLFSSTLFMENMRAFNKVLHAQLTKIMIECNFPAHLLD